MEAMQRQFLAVQQDFAVLLTISGNLLMVGRAAHYRYKSRRHSCLYAHMPIDEQEP